MGKSVVIVANYSPATAEFCRAQNAGKCHKNIKQTKREKKQK